MTRKPTVSPKSPQKAKSKAELRQAQEHLKSSGFAPGPIDGMLGPQTKEALRQYQEAHELPVTEKLDAATKKAMDIQ